MSNRRYDDEYEYPGKPRSRRIWWVLGGIAAAVLIIGYVLSSTA